MPITFGVILPPNPHGKNTTNSQINLKTSDENKNSEVHTMTILLDSGASASIDHKDVLCERLKFLKIKKKKWPTMAGTFNTTFVAETI